MSTILNTTTVSKSYFFKYTSEAKTFLLKKNYPDKEIIDILFYIKKYCTTLNKGFWLNIDTTNQKLTFNNF